MALSDTLNTNEVKNAAGVEVEFDLLQKGPGRMRIYKAVNEPPARPHRLGINHSESGTGLKRRRRSNNRVDKTVTSDVDNVTPVTISAYAVVDAPVGALTATTEIANVIAELISWLATLGGTTVLYDCTGNGAKTLLNGES